MVWDLLHTPPPYSELPFSADHAPEGFLFQGTMSFHQELSGSTVIFPRASEFLSSLLLLEFIQIKQETINKSSKPVRGRIRNG